jgi:predicted  nucleic acid-binding Zn-ribbon protein
MQLRVARVCLDCEEIHDAQQCPACGSESFAFISRWVPAPERRARARPALPDDHAETYRQLLATDRAEPARMRWLKRGAFGLAAVAVARWMWGRRKDTLNP